jgi:hypothetical protein
LEHFWGDVEGAPGKGMMSFHVVVAIFFRIVVAAVVVATVVYRKSINGATAKINETNWTISLLGAEHDIFGFNISMYHLVFGTMMHGTPQLMRYPTDIFGAQSVSSISL